MILCFFSMLLYSVTDVSAKRSYTEGNGSRTLKICCVNCFYVALIGFIIWLLGLGESGLNPFQLLIKFPMFIISSLCTIAVSFLIYFSLKLIPVSLSSTIQSCSEIVPFFAVLIVFLITKTGLEDITLLQIIGVIFCIGGFIAIMITPKSNTESTDKRHKISHSLFILGIVLTIVSLIFDSADSIVISYALSTNMLGEYDVIISYVFPEFLAALVLYIYICITEKKMCNLFSLKNEKFNHISSISEHVADFLYVFAVGMSPLLANLLVGLYSIPVFLMARFFLKEKLTVKQYIGIGLMFVGIVCFTLAEGN